jgi:hypothetical protein
VSDPVVKVVCGVVAVVGLSVDAIVVFGVEAVLVSIGSSLQSKSPRISQIFNTGLNNLPDGQLSTTTVPFKHII